MTNWSDTHFVTQYIYNIRWIIFNIYVNNKLYKKYSVLQNIYIRHYWCISFQFFLPKYRTHLSEKSDMNKPTLTHHFLQCMNPQKDNINEPWCLEHKSNNTGVTLKLYFKPCHTHHKYMHRYKQYLIYLTTFNLQSTLCLLYSCRYFSSHFHLKWTCTYIFEL